MNGAPAVAANRPRQHAPGLDGIRGVAVAAIVAYHTGFIDGGLLSVTVFFALSGFLITSILLGSFRKSGSLELKTFWLRRARRLLPALVMLLGVVLVAAAIARPTQLKAYSRQAFSALIYMANWATIARGDTYFNRFTGPGPFDHLWSLAIEEQFYALWPLFVLGALWLFRRRADAAARTRTPLPLIAATALLAAASAYAMAYRFAPDALNNTRAYEGTDARAAPILIGALAAMILPLDRIGEGGKPRRIALEILGIVATIVAVKVTLTTHEDDPFLYRGGEAVVAIASAFLVVAAGHPRTIVGKVFGFAPFRWLGERTYGIYLWHMPIVAFMPTSFMADHPYRRGLIQLVLILGLAACSWTLLEDPIRRNGLVATFSGKGWKTARRWVGAVALVPLAIACIGAWPLLTPAAASESKDDALLAELEKEEPEARPIELANAIPSVVPPASSSAAAVVAPPLLTSCKTLVHVGDSTSIALMSATYIPAAADRLDARYGSVGVRFFVPEISGGRSIVEKLNGHPSAYEIVAGKKGGGYDGCWVLAIGNGDGANVKGNGEALAHRIDSMMKATEGRNVLWATTKTLLDKGPYQNAYMESWNHELVEACSRHPNMRVYDWASEVQDDWYIADKIHPNEIGAKERAARFARALAIAFPREGAPAASCLVRSSPQPAP